jgi:putative ABC transport system ATP-binding protein
MTGEPIVRIEGLGLSRSDGGWGFTLTVPRLAFAAGERLALFGDNGSGKSTLIELIALALAPAAGGSYRLAAPGAGGDFDVINLWRRNDESRLTELRRDLFGYIQQIGGLLEFLTIRQNVGLTQRLSGRRDAAWLDQLIARLEIGAILDRYPSQVSVGQRQRATIVRALAHRPMVILADEPTASLDRASANWVMQLLVEQAAEAGTALVVASHERDLIEQFGFEPIEARIEIGANGQSSFFERQEASP